ncbi:MULTISPECIES: phage tail assembly chaperone [Pseudomonas]|uniref:Phage tail assembly chaperone n=1 Tax=Pseudomonas maumuensis TaxID=2842354 RepID=A0ABX8NN39_9PSED|nr:MULTISPECIES: phage tail assembly chaperone [Pseudomonas]QXH57432.1 phage tail assembly chaperone [Pseudomonas maumuensis]
MNKHYRQQGTGQVYAYAADGSEDEFKVDDLVLMTGAELQAYLNPPKTQEQIEATERTWRDAAVNDVLWLRERHRDELDMQRSTTLTGERFTELLAYLQALRDWPQSEAFPDRASRPLEPVWVQEASA